MNESVNYGGVCRTAPATPGLLKIRSITLQKLDTIKLGHDKVRKIVHTDLNQPQAYTVSNKFTNKEKSLLFNLWSMCENSFRDNFHNRYQTYRCQFCSKIDTQEHALLCNETTKYLDIEDRNTLQTISYNDLFGTVEQQIPIVRIFAKLISIRKKLSKKLDDMTHPSPASPPWRCSGPCGWYIIVLTQRKYIIIILYP